MKVRPGATITLLIVVNHRGTLLDILHRGRRGWVSETFARSFSTTDRVCAFFGDRSSAYERWVTV